MKSVVCASLVAAAASSSAPLHVPNYRMLFDQFIAKYGKTYSESEKNNRFTIFCDNVDIIYASNSKNKTYTLGLTIHADLTREEYRDQYLSLKPTTAKKERAIFKAPPNGFVPASIDWVAKGGVTSVKNQGQCGSCWAFSTVGALEGAMHASGRTMVDLSMQHIMNCDPVDHGCHGGLMDNAFDWVAKNGVTALKDEPYEGKVTQCSACQKETGSNCIFSGSCEVGVCNKAGLIHRCECPGDQCYDSTTKKCGPAPKQTLVLAPGDVTGHTDVDTTENALEAAVAQQPVSVAIEADQSAFQLYSGGVLTSDGCGEKLDHGVLAVGYGEDNGQKYWKVKNSWGANWGEHGYIRLAKGAAESGGECGIRKGASFPTVKAAEPSIVV